MKYVLIYMILTNGMNSGVTGTAEFNTLEACKDAAAVIVWRSIKMPTGKLSKNAKAMFDAYPDPWAECLPKGANEPAETRKEESDTPF